MKATDFKQYAQYADIAQVAQKVSQDVKDYLVIAEQEQAKRAQIKSDCKIELARIGAIRSTFEMFLDRSFDERRRNFEELFDLVKGSIDRGDLKALESSLNAVVELAKVSPLAEAKSLASLRSAMDDPDHEFTI
jgi:hypothetical protein